MSIIKITKHIGCINCGTIYDEEQEDCPNCSDPYIHCPHCNQLSFDKSFDQCDECYYPHLQCQHGERHTGDCSVPNENLEPEDGYTSPGLFQFKDTGSGTNAIVENLIYPQHKDDLDKHLEQYHHPGIEDYPVFDDSFHKMNIIHNTYHYNNNDNNDNLEHDHDYYPNTNNAVTLEELIGGQPHPNMRLPLDSMSDDSKKKHLIEEHNYKQPIGNDEYIQHELYHKNPSQLQIELELGLHNHNRSELGIGFPHEHWQTINPGTEKEDNIEDILKEFDRQHTEFQNRRNNGGIERNSHKEDIIVFAKSFWNAKDDITIEEYADHFFKNIEKI